MPPLASKEVKSVLKDFARPDGLSCRLHRVKAPSWQPIGQSVGGSVSLSKFPIRPGSYTFILLWELFFTYYLNKQVVSRFAFIIFIKYINKIQKFTI